jgi:hypothetical protein
MVQLVLHPSPSMRLLSSHSSLEASKPSPQDDAQLLGSELPHAKPHSTKHEAEQPSRSKVFWSSHVSLPFTSPSPHKGKQVVAPHPNVEQSQPSCFEQVLLHPSSSSVLPSSHSSSDARSPSPQDDVHAS